MDDNPTQLTISPSQAADREPIERIIFRSMNEGVITLECTGRIHLANAAARRILGFEDGELLGRMFHEVFPEDSANGDFVRVIDSVIREGLHTRRSEARFKRPDGQTVDLSVATSYLETDVCEPGLENVVVVFRDITAFKVMERARRRAVSHLSHELRTPLAIIDASLQRLISKSEDCRKPVQSSLERVKRNVHRLQEIQEIVQQIVMPPQFQPKRCNIRHTMERILEDIRRQSSFRNVTISANIAMEETDELDPNVVELLLKTLVKNAVEATPDGGTVTVSLSGAPDAIMLAIADTGVGIAVADGEFLFDGFHHTQETDEYSTRKPFEFNAGGKGLELLHLKVLSETGMFDIDVASRRCRFLPTAEDHCRGAVDSCDRVTDAGECARSGGTTFTVTFPLTRTSEKS